MLRNIRIMYIMLNEERRRAMRSLPRTHFAMMRPASHRSRFSLVLLSGNIVRHGILNLNKNTCYAWRKQFGDMISDDVKRLKALETENARLKTFDSGYFFVPVRRPICSLPP